MGGNVWTVAVAADGEAFAGTAGGGVFHSNTSGSSACPLPLSYWRTHTDDWPVDTLTLGSQSYDQSELIALLNTRRAEDDDVSVVLAHQLIASKLNLANGADSTPVGSVIAKSDQLLGGFAGKLPYAVERTSPEGRTMHHKADILAAYNHGALTPDCGP